MARYLLHELMFVRKHREDAASRAVALARRAVAEAAQRLADRKHAYMSYRQWREAEEDRLMASIMLRPVRLGDITDLRLEIAGMRENELDKLDQVHKAEHVLDQAQAAMQEAQRAYVKASQELEKLVEHQQIWQRETDLELERQADLELEDYMGPPSTLNRLNYEHN